MENISKLYMVDFSKLTPLEMDSLITYMDIEKHENKIKNESIPSKF